MRPPLSEHPGNAPAAEPSATDLLVASAALAKQHPDMDEDPLFWTAVEGCMAIAGAMHFSAQSHQHTAPAPSWAGLTSACCEASEDTDDGSSAMPSQMPTRAPSPTHFAIGAVGLNGKKLRSTRCGQCRGCNSGDCGKCINCVDKPKFGGPGCRKQACVARTCSQPRVLEPNPDDDVAAEMNEEIASRQIGRKRDLAAMARTDSSETATSYSTDRSRNTSPTPDHDTPPAVMHQSSMPLAPAPVAAAPVAAALVAAAPVAAKLVTAGAPIPAMPVVWHTAVAATAVTQC